MEAVASLNAAIAHLEQAELSLQARKSIALLEQAELSLQARKSTTIPAKHGTTKTDVVGGLLKDLHDVIQTSKQIAAWKQDKLHAVTTSNVKHLILLAETLRYVANNDSLLSSKISTQHITVVKLRYQLKLAVRNLEEIQEGASGNTVIDTAVASKSGNSRPMDPASSVAYPTTSDNESTTADKRNDVDTPSDASALLLQKPQTLMRTCNECRSKKIKCDGKQPCTQCQVYSYECTYDNPPNRRRNPDSQYIDVESRLQRTEALIRNWMPVLYSPGPALDPAVEQWVRLREQALREAINQEEALENRLQRAEVLAKEFMPDGDLKDPTSEPSVALPSTPVISGSDNARHIRFIDPQQGNSHSETGNLDDVSESAYTDTSGYSRSSMHDMASTAPTEPVVDASNESEILSLFVSLVHRSDAVVKALDHIVASKQTDRTAAEIAARVRASLKSFVASLKLETPPGNETVPSLFLGRSRQISSLIIEAAISRRDAGNELPDGDDSDVSDDEIVAQDDDTHLDEEDDEVGGHSDAYVDTASFERVIVESNAFTEFLVSLYDIAFPDFATRLKRILRRFDMESSETQNSQVRELFSELAYAQPSEVIGTTHGPDFPDKVKNAFESRTGVWNWWPLSDPLKPLGPREMRISWTCRCGRTRNENVPEKVAKAIISLAKSTLPANSIPLRPSSAANLGNQPSPISSSGRTMQEASSSANPASSQDLSMIRLPSPGSLVAAYPNQQTRTIFLMTEKGAMHPKSMGLGQSQISTQGKCNDRFFKDVRSGYWTYRGWMRAMFSIYQFGFCEFYRFTEYAVNKYARGPQEEIPDLERHKNEYYYRKTVWTPQVSHEEFRDRFWNCLSDCDCNDNGTVDLIPQKIDETGLANDKVFYGIIAREEKQIYMAAIYLAIIGVSIIPSLWFFFNWLSPGSIADEALLSNRKGNLSNAIVPLSLCLTLLSCTLGVLIAI